MTDEQRRELTARSPGAHKAPEIKNWLAHPDRDRWHLHFTPTSSSWTNLVERWFKELTDWNSDPKPFIWKATTADIIAKVQRGRAALTRRTNSTTEH